MKYVIAFSAVALSCLALVSPSDAQKKKGKADDQVPPRRDEVPMYMRMLKAASPSDRAVALDKLGLRGMINADDVADAIEPLKVAVEKDADAGVRKSAARALGNIQPEPKATVPLLVNVVKNDKVKAVRLAATVALGQYGNDAKEAVPTLRAFAGEFKDNKKSPEARTIMAAVKMITGKKR